MSGRATWSARFAVVALVAVSVAVSAAPMASGHPLPTRPVIQSVSPSSGPVGTPVTITGLNFTGTASVKFNGVAASFTVTDSRTITTTVPPLATTGPVTVESVTSPQPFTVTFGVSLSPASGPPTSVVTVSGSAFTPHASVHVYFDDQFLAFVAADANGNFANATITVPASATPGKHPISAFGNRAQGRAKKSFLVNTDWPQLGYSNAHTGTNPYENVLSPSTVSGLTEAWSFTSKRRYGGEGSSPAVVNGTVYIGLSSRSRNNFRALNAKTGHVIWSFSPGGVVDSSPAVANGIVYFGDGDGDVYALNAATGALVWWYMIGHGAEFGVSAPAVANGIVYVGDAEGTVYALNAATGAYVWSYTTSGEFFSPPAVANGIVYIGGDNGDVVDALNAATGALVWSYPIGHSGDFVASAPAVANGIVYIGEDDGKVYALNAATGALVWTHTTAGPVDASPAVANGIVYIGSEDHKVYALNAGTGALVWTYTTGAPVAASPAVANGVVYIGSDVVYGLNAATGIVAWFYNAGTAVDSSPAIANGAVYISSAGGGTATLHAFGLAG